MKRFLLFATFLPVLAMTVGFGYADDGDERFDDEDRVSMTTAQCMEHIQVTGALGNVLGDCWDLCSGVRPPGVVDVTAILRACHDRTLQSCGIDVPCTGAPIPLDGSPSPLPSPTVAAE